METELAANVNLRTPRRSRIKMQPETTPPVTRRLRSAGWFLLAIGILLSGFAHAGHTPAAWYEPGPEDANANKVDDAIEGLPGSMRIGIQIGFLEVEPDAESAEDAAACITQAHLDTLDALGSVAYRSTVVNSVIVEEIRVDDVLGTVATWPEVGRIWLDEELVLFSGRCGRALAAHAGPYSPDTAEDLGFTGAGITIAIIDTGIDDHLHQDLPPAVGGIFAERVNGRIVIRNGNVGDHEDHGTPVAGLALGRPDASGTGMGIAPGAELFDCRASIAPGNLPSAAVQGCIDWLTLNAASVNPPIRVVNISLGGQRESAGTALTASIEALVASGVVVCVAAGNHDSCPTTDRGDIAGIADIAVASTAITVAAASHESTDDRGDDVISGFSRRGPGIGPEPKPNITAYGANCPPACPIGCAGPLVHTIRSTRSGSATGYRLFSGTSAASPLVAGAAALLLEQDPTRTPADIKLALLDAAEDKGQANWDPEWGQGLMDLRPLFPFMPPPADCDLSVTKVEYTPSPVACFQPVTVSVTVKNVGATPVDDFAVVFERWFFGPNAAPPVLFPLAPGPVRNTQGPLGAGVERIFQVDWTPGVSDQLPLSQHSCFWGTVVSACDVNPTNDRRNRNATIVNLNGNQCFAGADPRDGSRGGEFLEVPFRIGHPYPFPIDELLVLENPDPDSWYVEMEVDGQVSEDSLFLIVDMQDCSVFGTVRAIPIGPDPRPEPVTIRVSTYSKSFGFLGDMEITFEPPKRPIEDCGAGGVNKNTATPAFLDDMENGVQPHWSRSSTGDRQWSIVETGYASSGRNAWFVSDDATYSDSNLDLSIDIGSTATTLGFAHTFQLQNRIDGAVLEVSTDGGATFVDVEQAGAEFLEGGYTGTIGNGEWSPLAGRNAWTGGTLGTMSTVRVDLSAFAGMSDIRVRFRLGSDGTYTQHVHGWEIDDVALYDPADPCGSGQRANVLFVNRDESGGHFFDDMEAGEGPSWSHSADVGIDDWAIVPTPYANSPSRAWSCIDDATVTDKRLDLALGSIDDPDLGLTFWHTYRIEPGFDGAILEASGDGGTTFTQLDAEILEGGYTGILDGGFGNPLGAVPAWTGGVFGAMERVRVDLSAYRQTDLVVRFRFGADECCGPGPNGGWQIDDVRVTGMQDSSGTGGDDFTVELDRFDPIRIQLDEPPALRSDGQSTRACIYLWLAEPAPQDVVSLPKQLGKMCFGPQILATRAPRFTFNSLGYPSKLGGPVGSFPTIPEGGNFILVDRPGGAGVPISITAQGIIEDPCSSGTVPLSVTNAVLMDIR